MKKKITILIFCLLLISTTGCELFQVDEIWQDSYELGEIIEDTEYINDIYSENIILSEIISTENNSENLTALEEKEEIKEETTEEKTSQNTNEQKIESYNFYYNQLNDKQKNSYAKLLESCNNFESEIMLGEDLSEYDIYKVIFAFQNDNPLYYWIDNFTYKTINKKNENSKIYVSFDIPQDAEEVTIELKNKANNIVKNIPDNYSEYEKVKYIYEYIIDNTEYIDESAYNQDIRSVLLYNQSVCSGYAYTYQYLCQLIGINCTTVCGDAFSDGTTEPHAWNLLYLDGDYYWVDATWGDAFYNNPVKYDYSYFLTNDKTLLKTHTINDSNQFVKKFDNQFFNYPKCNSDKYDYYKLNNCLFEEYDKNTKEFISNKFKNGDTIINIKFKDKTSLDNAYKNLFEEKEINKILSNSIDLSQEVYYRYLKIEDNNVIILWLE